MITYVKARVVDAPSADSTQIQQHIRHLPLHDLTRYFFHCCHSRQHPDYAHYQKAYAVPWFVALFLAVLGTL